MKRFFCVLLFIAAVIGGLLLCDHVTRRDDSERKFRSFYDEKQDIDVFFMGTSHVLDDITPMELWFRPTAPPTACADRCASPFSAASRLAISPYVAVFP